MVKTCKNGLKWMCIWLVSDWTYSYSYRGLNRPETALSNAKLVQLDHLCRSVNQQKSEYLKKLEKWIGRVHFQSRLIHCNRNMKLITSVRRDMHLTSSSIEIQQGITCWSWVRFLGGKDPRGSQTKERKQDRKIVFTFSFIRNQWKNVI